MHDVTVNGVPTGETFAGPITVKYGETFLEVEPFTEMTDARRRFNTLVMQRVENVYLYVGDRVLDAWNASYDYLDLRALVTTQLSEAEYRELSETGALEAWIDAQLAEAE